MKNILPSVFLLGYGGANNTGSEIRILTIVNDVRAAFGEEVRITLGTVNKGKTEKIISEDKYLKLVELPYIFPVAVWQLTKAHNITILVEGSTFKDNWSSALLYLFLWGAWSAKFHKNLSVAYAVDAGKMGGFNQRLTKWVCNKMDLIITRSNAARMELHALGVNRDIAVTTDTAFQFLHHESSKDSQTVVGIAPVEFHQWPVKFRLWGARGLCYHWPYYFSWNKQRAEQSNLLVTAWVNTIRHIAEDCKWKVKLIAMEELDTRICYQILERLPAVLRNKVELCFAGTQTPQRIVSELRDLDYLITSRYHACVLSMSGEVPQIAVYHDERLSTIYNEMGLSHYAIKFDVKNIDKQIKETFGQLISEAKSVKEKLGVCLHTYYMPRCLENRNLLREWYQSVISTPKVSL